LESEKQQRMSEVTRLNSSLSEREKEIEEMQMQMLDVKSKVIEKDSQIDSLMERLA